MHEPAGIIRDSDIAVQEIAPVSQVTAQLSSQET